MFRSIFLLLPSLVSIMARTSNVRTMTSIDRNNSITSNCTSLLPSQCQLSTTTNQTFSNIFNRQPNVNIETEPLITFSEFPIGTAISGQYKDKGIIFGDGTFITTDGSNPTSPVLSGTPLFAGPIEGQFVVADTSDPSVVESFAFDAGYFDAIGSTRLIIYDQQNRIIDQKTNTQFGIQNFVVSGGGISKFQMEIFEDEPNGFAIDNLKSKPVQSSIIFRESELLTIGIRPWRFDINTPIPGFDHVAMHINDMMYESHPGYTTGTYRGADPKTPTKNIVFENGVQSQFTRLLFLHNSQTASSPTVKTAEVPIPLELAVKMRDVINSKADAATYLFPDFPNVGGSWSNANQKGAGGKFTCVGLVEWAAEQAGHNDGQGFVPNSLETVNLKIASFPLLSPELLYFCARTSKICFNPSSVFGFVDPVDFVVTDPLGRRLGYTNVTGVLNEIPGAFVTPNGALEQFVIPAAIPGIWTMEYIGLGENVRGAIVFSNQSDVLQSKEFDGFLKNNDTLMKEMFVPIVPGTRGDVNFDGILDMIDVDMIQSTIGRFTEGLYDPYDLTGDGKIKQDDVDTLLMLINIINNTTFSPTPSPTIPPKLCADQTGQPIRRLFCFVRNIFRRLFGNFLGF